ncbi:hypothetical protein JW707_05245 [Candidatus Woesearchaeota archaeon]|nr:hypothetical protein [Candidatus Woesearchaeota archaeon]
MSGDLLVAGGGLPIQRRLARFPRGKSTPDGSFFRDAALALNEFSEANRAHLVNIGYTSPNSISLTYTTPLVTQNELSDFLDSTFNYDQAYRKSGIDGVGLMSGMMTASFPVTLAEILFPGIADLSYELRFTEPQAVGNDGCFSEIEIEIRKYEPEDGPDGNDIVVILANCYNDGEKKAHHLQNRHIKKRGSVFVGITGTLPKPDDEDSKIYIPLEDEIFSLFYDSRLFNNDYILNRLGKLKTPGYLLSLIPGQIAQEGKRLGLEGRYWMQTLAFNGKGITSDDFTIGIHFNETKLDIFREQKKRYLKPETLINAGGYIIAAGQAVIIAPSQPEDTRKSA